jgi:hypothetical protein
MRAEAIAREQSRRSVDNPAVLSYYRRRDASPPVFCGPRPSCAKVLILLPWLAVQVKLHWIIGLTALATVLGCDPRPRALPCSTYVAGGFNRENQFSFAVEGEDWPALADVAGASIELTMFFASGKPGDVDLVHVVKDHELERWTLKIPPASMPTCSITGSAGTSTCGAIMRILPQHPRGYWYLKGNDDLLEAGMSFVLCRSNPVAVPAN